jgi:hypothetical protein
VSRRRWKRFFKRCVPNARFSWFAKYANDSRGTLRSFTRLRSFARLRISTRGSNAAQRLNFVQDDKAFPATAGLPPYLVLLRVGFALPARSLARRCALTAPFHPYPAVLVRRRRPLLTARTDQNGGAVCFLWHFPSIRLEPDVPDVIRHTALRSSDFPPSSLDATRATARPGCLRKYYTGFIPWLVTSNCLTGQSFYSRHAFGC